MIEIQHRIDDRAGVAGAIDDDVADRAGGLVVEAVNLQRRVHVGVSEVDRWIRML